MIKNKNIILLIYLQILLISCNKNQDDIEMINQDITFKVDYDLLNKSAFKHNTSFKINMPLNWETIDSTSKSLINQNSSQSIISLDFLEGFQSQNLSSCLIYKVNSKKQNFKYLPEGYVTLLKDQFSVDKINIAEYRYNSNSYKQFIIINEKITLIKLFVNGINNYQVDFFIPNQNYQSEIANIESSIGSINQ